MLESEDPKERMKGVSALSGNGPMLKEVLESLLFHCDVTEAVARELTTIHPEMLIDIVPKLCSTDIRRKDEDGEPAYKAVVEVLASMVDELNYFVDDFIAYVHIALVSENALARKMSVKRLKERKSLLDEIRQCSNFEDTRKQAKVLMAEIQDK